MKNVVIFVSVIALTVLVAACGARDNAPTGKVIKSGPAGNNLTVSLASSDGAIKHGKTEFTITFADASGKPADVGAVALTFHMPQMGTMAEMNDAASLTTTDTPGVYRGTANVESAGEWQARITYDGPKGRGQANIQVFIQ